MPDVYWFTAVEDETAADLVTALRRRLDAAGLRDAGNLPPGHGSGARKGGGTSNDVAVIVWVDHPLPDGVIASLRAGAGPLVLAGPTLERADPDHLLADAAGLTPGEPTALHDIRIRAGHDGAALLPYLADHASTTTAHLGPHSHVTDRVLTMAKTAEDVEVLLTATVGLVEHPVTTWRPATRVLSFTLGGLGSSVAGRSTTRLLLLAVRHALGLQPPRALGVGLLGYGAIGDEHSAAIAHVPGLALVAVADPRADRRAAARQRAQHARGYRQAEALFEDPDVDLVIVSTPPNTHARWANAALRAGRHVVVEKPFALRTEEADAVLALARERGRLALVYQNRRFDPDYLAVRAAVRSGLLGEVFHVETFVGGYGHPCNLWHSDAAVSGGAFYDWGAHVLDHVLDLLPGDVVHVSAVEQKRVWFDVTNADHSRVSVLFDSGAEATFVYSDLAAALKPRWYLLGTRAAIVSTWRTERVISRSDIGTLVEDVLAPADSPPLLDLVSPDGSVTRLATPPARPHAFHAELAERIQFGLPATVTGEQSRRVLAVMEAAAASARDRGRPVVPRGGVPRQ